MTRASRQLLQGAAFAAALALAINVAHAQNQGGNSQGGNGGGNSQGGGGNHGAPGPLLGSGLPATLMLAGAGYFIYRRSRKLS